MISLLSPLHPSLVSISDSLIQWKQKHKAASYPKLITDGENGYA
jgi:hypothetical protein